MNTDPKPWRHAQTHERFPSWADEVRDAAVFFEPREEFESNDTEPWVSFGNRSSIKLTQKYYYDPRKR